jgi:hypothetical protein
MLEVGEGGACMRYQYQIATMKVQSTDGMKIRYVAIDVAVQPEQGVVLRMRVRVHALLAERCVLTGRVYAMIADGYERFL